MKNRPSGEVLWLTRYLEEVSSLKEHRKGKFLFHQSRVTSHESRILFFAIALLRYFVASSPHSRSSSHAESPRRNSPLSSAPCPPACPARPGSRPSRLPANTPKLARTPANGPSSPSGDQGRTRGPR